MNLTKLLQKLQKPKNMAKVFLLYNFGPPNGGQIDFEFWAEQINKFIHFMTRIEIVILPDLNKLDMKFRKDNLTNIEIELILKQYVKVT